MTPACVMRASCVRGPRGTRPDGEERQHERRGRAGLAVGGHRLGQPRPDPGAAGEGAIASFVADWLARAGLDVTREEPVPGAAHVVAVARGTGGGRSLMLNGHMDTVGVAGMNYPHTPEIVGDRLYGRGAYDMKGGLAAIMLAGAAAAQHRPRGDVIVTAVCDEEKGSIGTESVLKRWRADAAVITEPTGLAICIAHRGFVWLDIEVTGVAAHGSMPILGSTPSRRWARSSSSSSG